MNNCFVFLCAISWTSYLLPKGTVAQDTFGILVSPIPARIHRMAVENDYVTTVKAIFRTDSSNCNVYYSLDGKQEDFKIGNRCKGDIQTARNITQPIGHVFELTIKTRILQSAEKHIRTIKITVVEENAIPYIKDMGPYREEIPDTSEIGQLVMSLSVEDDGREIYYFLQKELDAGKDPWWFNPPGSLITINTTTGDITVAASLKNVFSPLLFDVGIFDGASPQPILNTTLNVTIKHTSVNFEYCSAETTSNFEYGVFDWPITIAGKISTLKCPLGNIAENVAAPGHGQSNTNSIGARRTCKEVEKSYPKWQDPNTTQCEQISNFITKPTNVSQIGIDLIEFTSKFLEESDSVLYS